MGILYGTMFLFLYRYPHMWTENHRESIRVRSSNYISAAIEYFVGVNVAGHLNGWIYTKPKAHNGGRGQPEFRIPAIFMGTLLVSIGLIWWGWSGQARMHWIMPNIRCFTFTVRCYVYSSYVSLFLIDTCQIRCFSVINSSAHTKFGGRILPNFCALYV